MILVTGASGRLGGATVRALLETVPAAEPAVLVRDPGAVAGPAPAGVIVRRGDYDDPASLKEAFDGVDRLLFVSSPDLTPGVRPRQHRNVVEAAVAAGVGHVVYTSAIAADAEGGAPGFLADHTTTESLLRDSGLPVTLLRNTFYTDLFVNTEVVRAAVESGETVAADGDRALTTATIDDLARAAATVLTSGDAHIGHAYELRGPRWTYDELAATLTEESGRPVTHRRLPLDEAGELAFVGSLVSSGLFAEPSGDLEDLLGRPGTGIRELVRVALARLE